jgi:hypothetical protein
MARLDRIREVKAKAPARLLAIPGVHSIAIGLKVVAGWRSCSRQTRRGLQLLLP